MLSQPKHHHYPFPFFYDNAAFSDAECAALEDLFLQDAEWQHRDGAFYRCSLRDVTDNIPALFQTQVLDRMREITGLPIVNRVLVTAQRMLPGQIIGIHSDRPLLGYEIARLVVQLNKEWQAEHGGVLQLFTSPKSEVAASINPEYNKAFGFVLNVDSYHGVTEVTQPRQTVVFNFWHAANTPELAAHIQALLTHIKFSELPSTLDPIASAAELSLPEETTLHAGTAAIALQRWGYNEATIAAGYQHSAGLSIFNTDDAETYAAVLLADWVAYLHRNSFDLAKWEILCGKLEGIEVYARLKATWQLCMPLINSKDT